MAVIKATPDEKMEAAVRRWRSFKTVESWGDIIRHYRETFRPQQGGPTLLQIRELCLLCVNTILLMEDDEKYIQKMLEALEKERT